MKVLYITSSWFVDGDFPLVRNLVKQGVEVHLCIKIFSKSPQSTLFNLTNNHLVTEIIDSSLFGDSIDKFKSYLGINKIHILNHAKTEFSLDTYNLYRQEKLLIESIQPDIIHYISFPSFYEFPLIKKYGKKCLVTVHDPLPHIITRKTKVTRLLRLITNKSVGHFLLLNKKQTDEFKTYYRVSSKKILHSKLGNFDVIKIMGDLSVKSDNSVLYFGRISPYKGIDYLLPAFVRIQKKFPDVKLVVAGGGKYYFDVEKYKNNPQIEFINRYVSVDELATLVRKSQFVICPYTSATQSGVVASAFALSKPVVATNVGGLPDMIENGKTGLLIEPCNEDQIADSMDYLLSTPDKIKEMSAYIEQQDRLGDTSWRNISNIYVDYYNKIRALSIKQ